MPFRKSDVFHVVDTLHNGVVGSWQVFRMGKSDVNGSFILRTNDSMIILFFSLDPFLSSGSGSNEQVKKGVIPNKARAEEIATRQFNAAKKEQNSSEQSKSTSSFFKRKREKSRTRSKSLGKVSQLVKDGVSVLTHATSNSEGW